MAIEPPLTIEEQVDTMKGVLLATNPLEEKLSDDGWENACLLFKAAAMVNANAEPEEVRTCLSSITEEGGSWYEWVAGSFRKFLLRRGERPDLATENVGLLVGEAGNALGHGFLPNYLF